MTDDQQLLRRYSADRSEVAFRELVQRYVNLVYSTALRRVGGDAHLAQDVSQLVFTDLARKAPSLPDDVVLAGWLHRATRYAASQLMRTNDRRRRREEQAIAMNALESQTSTDWETLRPVLDEALDGLSQTDRDAVVLRFFEQRNLAEVGRALGTNEDAARKRVNRALDKLRAQLIRRGLATTAAAISTAISVNAVQIAPTGLAAALTTTSIASAGTASGVTATIIKIMSLTKLQLGIGASVIAVLTASLMIEHQSQTALRKESETLRRQTAQLVSDNEALSRRVAGSKGTGPRLPAPATQFANDPNALAADTLQSTNLYNRLKDKDFKLKLDQVEPYLRASGRNASSLLAAYRTTSDPALLTEAMRNFPDDPQVAFEAALRKDASPEEQRRWLDALKKSAPDNALGNYLSALDDFKTGKTDEAVKEFMAASGKSFQDYTSQRYQDDTEAYLAAGYSEADAKFASGYQLLLPQLLQTKNVGINMIDLARSYQQAGDSTSAQSALQMAVDLGGRYSTPSPGEPVISQLVGQVLQIKALSAMDPNAAYGSDGQTVQDQLNKIKQQADDLKQRASQIEVLQPQMSEQDWIIYRDRWLMFGEQNAGNWLISKYGQK